MDMVRTITEVPETKLSRVTAYLDPELKAKLEKLAKTEMRSVSQLIAVLASQAVEQAEREGKIDD